VTHETYSLILVSVVAVGLVIALLILWGRYEDEQEAHRVTRRELITETMELAGTKARLNKTERHLNNMAGAITPLLEKTAYSMGGITVAQMRSEETKRNNAVDRCRREFMSIPAVAEEGKRLVEQGRIFR
jgi:hypothetical protein